MGSDRFYPEERPVHVMEVDTFWIERHLVTNGQFARFVDETRYVTLAERPLNPQDYPGAPEELLKPGGLVFQPPDHPIPLDDATKWWAYVPGADWRHPRGPGTDLQDLGEHPVVQVSFEDAESYATWRGARMPTEAEWEVARAVGSRRLSTAGATSAIPKAAKWPIPGRATFLGGISPLTDTRGRHPSERSRRTATD